MILVNLGERIFFVDFANFRHKAKICNILFLSYCDTACIFLVPYIGKYNSIPSTNAYLQGVQDHNSPKEMGVNMILEQSTMSFKTKCFIEKKGKLCSWTPRVR